ncbi:hypothetical protein BDZ89DRAFT_1171985 [Hymenopellis radicata]|nr:hypothetical protein BDZ89DRAFT_1171985 [Hymenopellis radicata]
MTTAPLQIRGKPLVREKACPSTYHSFEKRTAPLHIRGKPLVREKAFQGFPKTTTHATLPAFKPAEMPQGKPLAEYPIPDAPKPIFAHLASKHTSIFPPAPTNPGPVQVFSKLETGIRQTNSPMQKQFRWGGTTELRERRESGRRKHRSSAVRPVLKSSRTVARAQGQRRLRLERLKQTFGESPQAPPICPGRERWMRADRWIDQESIIDVCFTCNGCDERICFSLEKPSLMRLREWNRHKEECGAILEVLKAEKLALRLSLGELV